MEVCGCVYGGCEGLYGLILMYVYMDGVVG